MDDNSSESRAKDRKLSAPARRALQEAADRRAKAKGNETGTVAELGGRKGPEPVRYGDWESKGIASDF